MEKLDDQYYQLLNDLQTLDFVLFELDLYLDTHPDDLQSIKEYNQFAQKRKQVAGQFEHLYGPLLHGGQSYSHHPWSWVEAPWPWQV
ncbi:MAG: cotJB protein [Paenibacillus sp. RIFOXYA1_FULL_44_5]|nr:MAG: cotJB protein [Paenibacillus sp. RIFOXYA1_FULL_44_5]